MSQGYSFHVPGIYFWYVYQVLGPVDTFGDVVCASNIVSAAIATRCGLDSLLDLVPRASGIGRCPHAESKRVSDAVQDRVVTVASGIPRRPT